jgi:antitoxin component of RelBE/YafQ-DinJ toxin-antitoxin module
MKKDKDIIIRVPKELKEELTKIANSKGLTLSAYIRMNLISIKDGE